MTKEEADERNEWRCKVSLVNAAPRCQVEFGGPEDDASSVEAAIVPARCSPRLGSRLEIVRQQRRFVLPFLSLIRKFNQSRAFHLAAGCPRWTLAGGGERRGEGR